MKLSIHLDGSEGNIFYPGQTITGHVRVEANREIKMRGIWLEVNGCAGGDWYEGSHGNRKIDGHFFCLKTYLTGTDDKNSEMILEPGVHTFPLSFHLPSTLPSSFDSPHGFKFIQYRVKTVVDRPHRIDSRTDIPITVIRWLDLNNEPQQIREPIEVKEEKPEVGCCYNFCCIKGLPEIELRINKGGFAPGETILLSGRVVNNSNRKIENTTINFLQEIELCRTYKDEVIARRCLKTVLSSIKRPPIERGRTDTWNDLTFTVPYVAESRLDGTVNVNTTYYIQVESRFPGGCCAKSAIRQKIVVGHIPLGDDVHCSEAIMTQPSTYSSVSPIEIPFPDQSHYSGVHNAEWNQDYINASFNHE